MIMEMCVNEEGVSAYLVVANAVSASRERGERDRPPPRPPPRLTMQRVGTATCLYTAPTVNVLTTWRGPIAMLRKHYVVKLTSMSKISLEKKSIHRMLRFGDGVVGKIPQVIEFVYTLRNVVNCDFHNKTETHLSPSIVRHPTV